MSPIHDSSAPLLPRVRSCHTHHLMDKKWITNRHGLPDRAVRLREQMRSRKWMCSNCGELTTASEPIPAPAPCGKCGRVLFETVE